MTSGNPILDKNLKCIEKYNPKLKDKLLNLPCLTNNIELVETDLKEPNLLYNGITLHSQLGADAEVEKAFDNISNTKMSRHIVFGMGLGYLFKKCCEESKGMVFLYEPNLEILRVTLELVDFSNELSQKNVLIFADMEFFAEIYSEYSKYKINTAFLTLPSYRNIIYVNEISNITNEFKEIMYKVNGEKETAKALIRPLIKSIMTSLKDSIDSIPLKEVGEIYKGKTALIVAAGPTLDTNIETIKKNRGKFVIFCVGQALKSLTSNGITPDFLCILEYKDCTGQVKGVDLSNINLIVVPCTHYNTFKLKVKKTFLFPNKSISTSFWGSFSGYDTSDYEVKSTVAYLAAESAKMLGCKKLILVGQDLAYLNNQCYSKKSAYSDLIFETNKDTGDIKLKVLDEKKYTESCSSLFEENQNSGFNQNLAELKLLGDQEKIIYVDGINGDKLPSLINYKLSAQEFSEYAEQNDDFELVNTSLIGAQIDGFKNISLEKAIENDSGFEITDASKVPISFVYNKNRILKKITEYSKLLQSVLIDLEKGKNIFARFEKTFESQKLLTSELINLEEEIKRLFEITSRIPSAKLELAAYEDSIQKQFTEYSGILDLKLKCIQQVGSIYSKIQKEQQYFLYKTLSYKEDLEVQFILDDSEKLTPSEIIVTYSALKNYFFIVKNECSDALDLLNARHAEFIKDESTVSNFA